MIRPISIVRYERLYWASFVLGLIVTAISWSQRVAMLSTNPILANATWVLPTTQAVGIAITLLLWYFTARTPSIVAKWVVVVFAALAVLGAVIAVGTLLIGRASSGMTLIVSLVVNALYVAAAVQLFKPDAKLWFGELPETDDAFEEDMPRDR